MHMQWRRALGRQSGGVQVTHDVCATDNCTCGEDSVRAELSGDVAINVIAAAVVRRTLSLVDRGVEDWDHGENSLLGVEALACHDDVERRVVVRLGRGVGAVRDLRGQPCDADGAEWTERFGTVDGDAKPEVTGGADASDKQVGGAVGIVGGDG